MVLVFCVPGDLLMTDLCRSLDAAGRPCIPIPPPVPGSPLKISWQIPESGDDVLIWQDCRYGMSGISGVVVRALPHQPRSIYAQNDEDYLYLEWGTLLTGWLQAAKCPVVNRPVAGRNISLSWLSLHRSVLNACGLQAGRMMVTDSPSDASLFFSRCRSRLLYMPDAWSRSVRVHDAAMIPEGISHLIALPEGLYRRIHVVGPETAAAMVMAEDGSRTYAEESLPESLRNKCCRLVQKLDLLFLELDVVSDSRTDVVIGAWDLPRAVFDDPVHRSRVAWALADLFYENHKEKRRP